MKSLILGFALILSAPTFAQTSSIAGVWYMPASGDRNSGVWPESLIEISDKNVWKGQLLFPDNKQKYVVIMDLSTTGDGKYKPLEFHHETKCASATMNNNEPIPIVVTNGQLVIDGVMKYNRATPEQVKKFEALQEGCN